MKNRRVLGPCGLFFLWTTGQNNWRIKYFVRTYLEICDPSIYIYVSTTGKKLKGPFAGLRKEGADCARTTVGEQPKHEEEVLNGLGRRSWEDVKQPQRTPSPGLSRRPCRWNESRLKMDSSGLSLHSWAPLVVWAPRISTLAKDYPSLPKTLW